MRHVLKLSFCASFYTSLIIRFQNFLGKYPQALQVAPYQLTDPDLKEAYHYPIFMISYKVYNTFNKEMLKFFLFFKAKSYFFSNLL